MKTALVLCPSLFRRLPLNGLAYLTAYLRKKNHEVAVFDINAALDSEYNSNEFVWQDKSFIEKFIRQNIGILDSFAEKIINVNPKVIGFSIWAGTKELSLFMAKKIKSIDNRIVIVFGGPECSFSGEELIRQEGVDAVVLGEGEVTFAELIDTFSAKGSIEYCEGTLLKTTGGTIKCESRRELKDLDCLPFPDYSDFNLDRYENKNTLPISFSRGCINRCAFCNAEVTWKRFRSRSAENVFREMQHLRNLYPSINKYDVDDTALNTDLRMLSALCDLIINSGLRFNWGGPAILRKEMDRKLIMKMAKAGCNIMGFGLESGSQKIIDSIGKGFKIADAERVIRDTFEAGMKVVLGIIIGFPGETNDDFQKTMDFIRRNRKYISWVHSPSECNILKGTRLHNSPEQYDVFTPSNGWWRSNDGTNTHEEREKRIAVFNSFLDDIGMTHKHYTEVFKAK